MFEYEKKPGHSVKQREHDSTSGLTGIPVKTQARFESQSGFSFNDVRVHYNSDKPKMLGALAYTQGNQVFIGSGQEKYLEHELGHVVQQKRGSVSPTLNIGGLGLNLSGAAEKEADQIGHSNEQIHSEVKETPAAANSNTIQMQFPEQDREKLTALYHKLQDTPPADIDELYDVIYTELTSKESEEYTAHTSLPPIPEDEEMMMYNQNPTSLAADYIHYESGDLAIDGLNSRFIVNVLDQESTSILVGSLITLMQGGEKANMKFKAFYGRAEAEEKIKYDKIVVYYNSRIPGLDHRILEALDKRRVEYVDELSAFYKPMDEPAIGWGVDEDTETSFSQIRSDMVMAAYLRLLGLPPANQTANAFLQIVELEFIRNTYNPERPWHGRTAPPA